jgi:hypothetical protein
MTAMQDRRVEARLELSDNPKSKIQNPKFPQVAYG